MDKLEYTDHISYNSENLEDLMIKKVSTTVKFFVYIPCALWFLSTAGVLISYLVVTEYKRHLLTYNYYNFYEKEENQFYNEPFRPNQYVLFCLILFTLFFTFIPFVLKMIINNKKVFSIIGRDGSYTLSFGLTLFSIVNLFSILFSINTYGIVLLCVFLTISSLILYFIMYCQLIKITFKTFSDVVVFRVFFGTLSSLYFFILLSLSIKVLEIDKTGVISIIIIENSFYGLVALYIINISGDSYFSISSIILELGALIDVYNCKTMKDEDVPDRNKYTHFKIPSVSERKDLLVNYIIILSLLVCALVINILRTGRRETFGFSSDEVTENLLKSKKEAQINEIDRISRDY